MPIPPMVRVSQAPPAATATGPQIVANSIPAPGSYTDTPTITYHGGPMMPSVQIEDVFYPGYDPTLQSQMAGFFTDITNSKYVTQLDADYSQPGQPIHAGTFLGSDIENTQPTPQSGDVLDDSKIRLMLGSELTANRLPDPTTTLDKIYFVFTPPGVEVTAGSLSSDNGFIAYHSSFSWNGKTVAYAVLPYQGPVSSGHTNTSLGGLAQFFGGQSSPPFTLLQDFTVAASHEMTEAITNTDSGWSDSVDPSGGLFPNGRENSDMAELQLVTLDGYAVQEQPAIIPNGPTAQLTGTGSVTAPSDTDFFINEVNNPTTGNFNGVIATFTDKDGGVQPASNFTAAVNWSDGNPNSQTTDGLGDLTIVSNGDGTYRILGKHTYSQAAGTRFGSNIFNFDGLHVIVTDNTGDVAWMMPPVTLVAKQTADVTAVTSPATSAYYRTGATLPIIVDFSQAVTVTGTPTLALNSGGTATYISGTGTTELTFNYTVAAGQSTAGTALDAASPTALTGTIKDTLGNAASLTMPTFPLPNSLGGFKNLVIYNSGALLVTTSNDGTDLNDGTSLRDALAFANTLGTATINFDSTVGAIKLKIDGDDTFGATALKVTANVTLDNETGLPISIARDTVAAPTRLRLFYVAPGASLTLDNLTISGGLAAGGNGSGNGGGAAAGLGGAFVNAGTLRINTSTLTGNIARGGNALSTGNQGTGGGLGGDGGNNTGGGPNGATFANAAGFGGGGVGGSPALGAAGFGGGGGNSGNGGFGGGAGANSNTTPGFGGGAGAFGPFIGGGGGGLGGAIFNYGGSVYLTNDTLAANSAVGGTGGSSGSGLGGAVFNLNGNIWVYASTLGQNTAAQGGGAIYSLGDNNVATQGGPALTQSSPGVIGGIALYDSIVAGSNNGSATLVSDVVEQGINGGSSLSSGNNDLLQTRSAGDFAGTSVITADPLFTVLGNYGGTTQTLPLLATSPAIGAGVALAGITTDQRGVTRHPVPDLGALENPRNQSLVVTTLTDEDNGSADPFYGAGVSLREAIAYAETFSTSQTVTFAPSLTSGGPATITLAGAQLEIIGGLTIAGPGANLLTVSANNKTRVLDISSSTAVSISGLTVSGGNTDQGGGIFNNDTPLNLNAVAINGNTASAFGGGFASPNGGVVTINNSTISGNTAGNEASAVENEGYGSAAASLTLTNCTISGNTVNGGGFGAISNVATGQNATLALQFCTVANNNSVGGYGGVIAAVNSQSAVITYIDTIFANTGANVTNFGGTVTSLGHNLSSDATGGLTAAGDLPSTAPLLSSLGDFGGPTPTMELLTNSPAIGAGVAIAGITTDQRGVTRHATPDIGAFEVTSPPSVLSVTPEDNAGNGVAAGSAAKGQRSMETQIAVVFSEPVALTSGAFVLYLVNDYGSGNNNQSPPTALTGMLGTPTNPSNDGVTWIIPIVSNTTNSYSLKGTHGGIAGASLNNGVYNLTVVGADVAAAIGGTHMAADITSAPWHRLYGDIDNARRVFNSEYSAFVAAFNSTFASSGATNYNQDLDYDGDGRVFNSDYAAFLADFGSTRPYSEPQS